MPKCSLEKAKELFLGGMSIAAIKREYEWLGSDKLIRKLEALLGGKEGWKKARAAGAGGRSFGGTRGTPRTPPAPIDDGKVPVITKALVAAGWKTRTLYPSRDSVLIDPKGVEYVRAKDNERADLIFKGKTTIARLRKLAESRIGAANLRKAKNAHKALTTRAKKKAGKKQAKLMKRQAISALIPEPETPREDLVNAEA